LTQTILNKVCRTPNYLFQSLIGRHPERIPHDTFVSVVLGLPLAAVSTGVSLVAPLFGQGGVLRMVARPRAT